MLDFHLFADDARLFYKVNTLNFQSNLNNELDKVFEWLCSNKFSLNVSKSNFVIFHSRQRTVQFNSIQKHLFKHDILNSSKLLMWSCVYSILKSIYKCYVSLYNLYIS